MTPAGTEDGAAIESPPPVTLIESTPPNWLRAVGLVALVTLVVQIALPLWVVLSGNDGYDSKLPTYHFWLGTSSVIHLATVATWVFIKERNQNQP